MSLKKISDLLKSGEMINVNLISEDLRLTLNEIYNILTFQSDQIRNLEKNIENKATPDDISKINSKFDEKFNNLNKETLDIKEAQKTEFEKVYSKIDKNQDVLELNIEDTKNKFNEDNESREKEIDGNLFIINQQIREINIKLLGQQNLISKNQSEIIKINRALDSGKNDSIEMLALRVEDIESKIQQFNSDFIENKNSFQKKFDDINELYTTFKEQSGIKMHTITAELKTIRQLVVDTPDITFESGVIDTETIIRAIQRDTRRIDNFNEALNAFKEEFVDIKAVFSKLSKIFNEFQTGVQDLIQDHNVVKKELFSKVAENVDASVEIARDLEKMNENLQFAVDSNFTLATNMQNMFIHIISYITKITHRSFPPYQSFDDQIADFQKQNDDIISFGEKFQQKIKKYGEIKNFSSVTASPFKLPVYQVQNPNPPSQSIKANFFYNPESSQSSNAVTSIVCQVDNEMRDMIISIKKELDEDKSDLKNFKDYILQQLNNKIDTQTYERYLERVKESIVKINEKINYTRSQLGIFVQHEELENLLENRISDISMPNVCSRSSLTIRNQPIKSTNTIIPKLKNNAHIVVYGPTAQSQRKT